MTRTAVAYFSASQASQRMCLKPELSRTEQARFTLDSQIAREVREILDNQDELTTGNQMYLESVLGEGWRERVEEMGYDLDKIRLQQR